MSEIPPTCENAALFTALLDAAMPDMDSYTSEAESPDSTFRREEDIDAIINRHFGKGTPCDILEDWLYNDANAEALYTELLTYFNA